MSADPSLPRAVREALADTETVTDGEGEAREQLARMTELLDQTTPSPALQARLLDTTAVAPLRFAPFFTRLAALFDLEEAVIEQRMTALADAKNWKRTGLRGIERIEVSPGPRLASASTSFVRFAPGTHFPKHYHLGFEQVFVLEGSYTDSHGVEHRAGELREWPAGTEHSFDVAKSEPCIRTKNRSFS